MSVLHILFVSEMVYRGFKVTISFCSLVNKGCNRVTEVVKDKKHSATRIEDGRCHELTPLEVYKDGGYPDYVTWQYRTQACTPHKFLHGPASLRKNKVIVYPCQFRKCFIACPCWICYPKAKRPKDHHHQKYQEHLLYHHAPHLDCELCEDLLKVFSSPTYMKGMRKYYNQGMFCSKTKAKDVNICAYIFKHSFNEERGYFRNQNYAYKQVSEEESRFKCEECGKQFTKSCNLNRH